MKLFRMFGRNIRDAFKSVIRNFSLSIASISCITITLVVVSLGIVASYNVNNFTKLIRQDVTLVVFINNDAKEEEINALETKIINHNNVESHEFLSKFDITKEMMSSSEVFKNIMESWEEEENPLYDEFLIKVKDISKIKETANDFKLEKIVNSVKYGEGIVDKLLSTFNVIENVSYIIVLALLLVTLFLISNTIKLTIYSRKKEISIMRLVGASNFSIKVPFVVEGLFLGIIGAIIPILITVYGYNTLYQYYGGQLFSPLIKLVEPTPFVYLISLVLVGIGVFVGVTGSYRAVRRHLKI